MPSSPEAFRAGERSAAVRAAVTWASQASQSGGGGDLPTRALVRVHPRPLAPQRVGVLAGTMGGQLGRQAGQTLATVQRDHEMVPGPGARDVQQALLLLSIHLLVELQCAVEVVGLDVLAELDFEPAVWRPDELDTAHGPGRRREPGDDHHGELQTLRRVDGHHSDGVDVGLRQHRLRHPRLVLGLPSGPGEVGPQPAVLRLRPSASLVDDEPQPPPRVPGSVLTGGDFHHPTVGDQTGEHLGRRQAAQPPLQTSQVLERAGHRVRRQRLGDRENNRNRPPS